jgi:hypothetical protein
MKRFTKCVAAGALALLAVGPTLAQQGQKLPGKPQVTGQQGMSFGGINQTPWFADKSVREHFKFTNDQFNALNKAYRDAWSRYNTNLGQLGANLTEAQRTQKMRELHASFHQNLNGSVDRLITDPQQRQRYNQLHLQYQGFSAFNDPTIQETLKLTDDQRLKLTQFGQEWNQQMTALQKAYQTDPIGATTRYNDILQQNNQRVNSVLNQQQQQT